MQDSECRGMVGARAPLGTTTPAFAIAMALATLVDLGMAAAPGRCFSLPSDVIISINILCSGVSRCPPQSTLATSRAKPHHHSLSKRFLSGNAGVLKRERAQRCRERGAGREVQRERYREGTFDCQTRAAHGPLKEAGAAQPCRPLPHAAPLHPEAGPRLHPEPRRHGAAEPQPQRDRPRQLA